MTFNFVLMTILLILLIVDYVFSGQTPEPHGVLVRKFNTPDTALIYGLLLYVLYVFSMMIKLLKIYLKDYLFSCI